MANERKYFVLCADNCKFESMTKEQILTAILQAISTGEIKDVDTGFVTTVKEQNSGAGLSFWVGTQAQYNAIETKIANCFYIITDDTTAEELNKKIVETDKRLEALEIDYIVEQGVNGIWNYRKWNSGIIECWGKAVGKTAPNNETSPYPWNSVELPCPLVTMNYVNIQACDTDSEGWKVDRVLPEFKGGKDLTVLEFVAYSINSEKSTSINYSINVKGTWK